MGFPTSASRYLDSFNYGMPRGFQGPFYAHSYPRYPKYGYNQAYKGNSQNNYPPRNAYQNPPPQVIGSRPPMR